MPEAEPVYVPMSWFKWLLGFIIPAMLALASWTAGITFANSNKGAELDARVENLHEDIREVKAKQEKIDEKASKAAFYGELIAKKMDLIP
jgi:hypothetical protein